MAAFLRPLVLIGLPAPGLARGAEVIGLLPVTSASVDPGTLEAARDVLRGHLEANGRQVRLAAGDPMRGPAALEAAAVAQAVGGEPRCGVEPLETRRRPSRPAHRLRSAGRTATPRQRHAGRLARGHRPGPAALGPGRRRRSRAAAVAEIDTVTDKYAAFQIVRLNPHGLFWTVGVAF